MDFSNRQVFETEDGSSSLRLREADEQYHSFHGACQESLHIYIQNGLQYRNDGSDIAILECGFGTGLNAALTFQYAGSRNIRYDAVEAYPLTLEEVKTLNYASAVKDFHTETHLRMHLAVNQSIVPLSSSFLFKKTIEKLENISFESESYDVVYYDMFNPDLQPELWTESIFEKIFQTMRPGGILVTYCAKGRVKRALKSVGFDVESLPGPAGKREITRAHKPSAISN